MARPRWDRGVAQGVELGRPFAHFLGAGALEAEVVQSGLKVVERTGLVRRVRGHHRDAEIVESRPGHARASEVLELALDDVGRTENVLEPFGVGLDVINRQGDVVNGIRCAHGGSFGSTGSDAARCLHASSGYFLTSRPRSLLLAGDDDRRLPTPQRIHDCHGVGLLHVSDGQGSLTKFT